MIEHTAFSAARGSEYGDVLLCEACGCVISPAHKDRHIKFHAKVDRD